MEDDKVLTPQEIWQMQLEHQAKIEKELDKLKQTQRPIIPAEPFTEPPKVLHDCWIANVEFMVEDAAWTANEETLEALRDGRVFPYTPEGKKAAEIRATRDYVPGWQDDVDKLYQRYQHWEDTTYTDDSFSLWVALHEFFLKYHTKKQNHD